MDNQFVETTYAGIEPREGPIEDAEIVQVCAADPGIGVSGASAPNASGLGQRGSRVGRAAPPDFFEKRGVSTKVAEARPYIPYRQGDSELLRLHWQDTKQAARIANQAGGIVIARHAPIPLGLTRVPAELRPNTEVVTGSHWHYHGEPKAQDELIIPVTGNRLPKKWTHAPAEMARHIEKKHGGVNDQSVHLDENRAKYIFPTGNGAKRLDVHPEAWPKFVGATRVFFGIEGCLKADAMLSAGEAVFSVPSVTLWNAPELASFTRYLRDKTVYIVPDADWFKNDAVMTQAMFCRTYLRKRGIDAHVAAPPIESYQRDDLKGVDDFLGYGGTVDDLTVLEREPRYGLAEFLAERETWRKDKVVRGAEVLESLALHAGADGTIQASLRSVARAMGVHHSRVERGLLDLVDCGAVTIEGSLTTEARWYGKGWEWTERPTIRIEPELRAKDTSRRLGD
jgi:hypothetical protein